MARRALISQLQAPFLHLQDLKPIPVHHRVGVVVQKIERFRRFLLYEHLISQIDIPSRLLTWVIYVLPQPAVVDGHGHLVGFALCQDFRPGSQVGPAALDFHQRFDVPALGFTGVARLQTSLLFALADELQQIIWNALANPVDAAFGMFPGTTHCKGHMYHPCVPVVQAPLVQAEAVEVPAAAANVIPLPFDPWLSS